MNNGFKCWFTLSAFLFVAAAAFSADSTLVFDQVYQGDFPKDLFMPGFKPAHLVKDQPDFLVTLDSTGFQAFRFDSSRWHQVTQTAFTQDSVNRLDRRPGWTVGDLNGDGADEIITWKGKKIIRLTLQSDRFVRQEFDFPDIVQQGVVGDVNNDGRSELVVFGYDEAFYRQYDGHIFGHALNLMVAFLDSGTLKILFADGGQMGYFDTGVVPPELLRFIAPLTSDSLNQLVIMGSQSDVSPAQYQVLQWDYGILRKVDAFHIINSNKIRVMPERPPKKVKSLLIPPVDDGPRGYPFSFGSLQPIVLAGQTCLFDQQMGRDSWPDVVLYPTPGDHFRTFRIVYQNAPEQFTGGSWMDPDGRGKGLLKLTYSPDGTYDSGRTRLLWHYSFYRLHAEP